MTLQGARILLIIGGGVAAYKALDLIRRLKERGARVTPVMTPSAHHFVTPLSVATLAESPVFSELFDLKNETEIGHIRLSREADLVILAPATANRLARMAHGLADDLAGAVLMAADKPVLAAPAMNWRMWEHPATRRNLALLKADGVRFVGPGEGAMACNEWGAGRMAETAEIIAAAEEALADASAAPLAGRHVLVTAGPTYEPIDPVRFIGNRSSGKQGYAIAAAAARLGARVTLVSGPAALPDPAGVRVTRVESAAEMLAATEAALPADAAIFAAAVADWRPAAIAQEKLKKGAGRTPPRLQLVENPDILKTVSARKTDRPFLVIGFAAETERVVENARAKRLAKGCDWVVANDVSAGRGTFGGDSNSVHLLSAEGLENWPEMSKDEVAAALMARVADFFAGAGQSPARAAE